jgi:2-dehydro-3-deoxy-D-gluconate 5-dehydrogenase
MESAPKPPLKTLTDLSGKTAIVTGGAMGIGYGISYRLAEAGAKVVIADLDVETSEKTVAELKAKGWQAAAVQTNVASEESVKNLVAQTVKTFGSIDILVNNAGIYPNIPVTQMTLLDFEKILAVNLKGVFLTTKYCSEQMISQGVGGRIVNITSIDALHPSMVGLAAYDASKHGLWGFTKNVALELAPHKIWVNAVAPGGIATPGVAKAQKPGAAAIDPKMMEAFMASIPMHRMGDPDDIGRTTLFLASEMASYMTGTQIVVDGGFLLT